MAEGKKITWKEFLIKGLYYDLMGSSEAAKLLRQFNEQRQLEKLEKKLAKAKPEDKAKIEREILLVKAKYWWWRKSFKEQWAMEKEAKRQKIKLDDYLIEEYVKTIKPQK
jgi:hypothetical protein